MIDSSMPSSDGLLRVGWLRILTGFLLVIALAPAGCSNGPQGLADEAAHEHDGIAVTLWTEKSELFFEYPPLVAGEENGSWAIHLTRRSDFSPITAGALTVVFRSPNGSDYSITADEPARPGIYTPAPQPPGPGIYQVHVLASGPQLEDRIEVGPIEVYADESSIPHDDSAADSGISFLKEQQWPIDFQVVAATDREIPVVVEVSGVIEAAPGRVVEVAAPVSGLALTTANLAAPAAGSRVSSGQALAVLSPTRQEDSFAGSRSEEERLRREVNRLTRLYDAEAIPERRLIEARSELERAEAAMEAIGPGTDSGFNLTLRSPLSGIVQESWFLPGQRVELGESLFRIVDPRVLRLRLHVPAMHVDAAGHATGAGFTVEGSDRLFRASRILSVGVAIDPASRTLPVLASVDNSDGALKIGQFLTALLEVGGTHSGVAIPNLAIQRQDGQSIGYVQTGGETFERRLLVLGPTDGTYSLVESGIASGEYAVTIGAYQVYLASLNTSDIAAEGHAH
ncbi:MAG: cobalt-zinc-cadmium efflux system membrane fusion protein [Rhodothermales bacterium]|jgi:cobalt-zinc-cadmium efflux system membrane fusion protein